MKSVKNGDEVEGMRDAHVSDPAFYTIYTHYIHTHRTISLTTTYTRIELSLPPQLFVITIN